MAAYKLKRYPPVGAKGYARLRKDDVDRRFPGLLDSIFTAGAATRPA